MKKKVIKKIYGIKTFSSISKRRVQKIGEYLERLTKEKGIVSPRELLELARPEDSILHDLFEWDDSVAAEKYRLVQARHIMNHLTVELITNGESIKAPAFINIELTTDEDGQGYLDIESVVKSKTLKDHMLEQAMKEMITWKARYNLYKELNQIFEVVEKVQKELSL